MPKNPSSQPASSAESPSADVRGLISLLIFLHLFAICVGLSSYVAPSELQERLRRVMGIYNGTLNFDLKPNSYPSGRFYLTHELPADVDFSLRVDGTSSEGVEKTVIIPEPMLWPPERRRHYQALVNAAGSMIGTDELEALLPRAIAESVLKQWNATRGSVRLIAHQALTPEDAAASDPARRDPFAQRLYTMPYDAHVLIAPDGRVDLVKKSAAGEVAPVEKGR